MSRTNRAIALRGLAPVLAFGAALVGCAEPDLYLGRRDTIRLSAGDAVASNIATHTIDPWPKHAARRNIEHDGNRMQAAAERYRTGKVTPLQGLSTSSIDLSASPASSGSAVSK
jgi:hypothetical protein